MMNSTYVPALPRRALRRPPPLPPLPHDAHCEAMADLLRVLCRPADSVLHIGSGDRLRDLPVRRGVHLPEGASLSSMHTLEPPFDYVVLDRVLHKAHDPWSLLRTLRGACAPHTRLLVSTQNPLRQSGAVRSIVMQKSPVA